MIDKLASLLSKDSLFWFCALTGSGMFVIQFLLSLIGNADHENPDSAEVDAVKVKWLSKQAVTGFLMMFGWAALTCQNQFNLPKGVTLVIALSSGLLTVLVTGYIFKMAKKMHSSGTLFTLDDAIGKEAIVYQRIPKGGVGKISISLHHLTHEIDAMSLGEEELPSFAPVRVVKKAGDNTVIVTLIQQ